ncbi:hypothetical protein OY671_011198, partial [Metschnikowia pulcherrima]
RRDGPACCSTCSLGTHGARQALPAARRRRPADLRSDVDRRPYDLCPPGRSIRHPIAGRRLQARARRPYWRLAQYGSGLRRLSRCQHDHRNDPLLADGPRSSRRRDRSCQCADRRRLTGAERPLRPDREGSLSARRRLLFLRDRCKGSRRSPARE